MKELCNRLRRLKKHVMNVLSAVLSPRKKYISPPPNNYLEALRNIERALMHSVVSVGSIALVLQQQKGDLSVVIPKAEVCAAAETMYGKPSLWALSVLRLSREYRTVFSKLLTDSLSNIDDFSIVSGLSSCNVGLELFKTQVKLWQTEELPEEWRALELRLAEVHWQSRRSNTLTEKLYQVLSESITPALLVAGACTTRSSICSQWCTELYSRYDDIFWRQVCADSAVQLRHTLTQLLLMKEVELHAALLCGTGRKKLLLSSEETDNDQRALAILGELVLFYHSYRLGWKLASLHWRRIELLLKDYLRAAFSIRTTALDMSDLQTLVEARQYICTYIADLTAQ